MGAFPGYRDARCAGVAKPVRKDNVDSMLGVIQLHRDAVEEIHPSEEFGYLKEEARHCWDRALSLRQDDTATATRRSPCSRPPARSRS